MDLLSQSKKAGIGQKQKEDNSTFGVTSIMITLEKAGSGLKLLPMETASSLNLTQLDIDEDDFIALFHIFFCFESYRYFRYFALTVTIVS